MDSVFLNMTESFSIPTSDGSKILGSSMQRVVPFFTFKHLLFFTPFHLIYAEYRILLSVTKLSELTTS